LMASQSCHDRGDDIVMFADAFFIEEYLMPHTKGEASEPSSCLVSQSRQ
jgi:hypothetical protein